MYHKNFYPQIDTEEKPEFLFLKSSKLFIFCFYLSHNKSFLMWRSLYMLTYSGLSLLAFLARIKTGLWNIFTIFVGPEISYSSSMIKSIFPTYFRLLPFTLSKTNIRSISSVKFSSSINLPSLTIHRHPPHTQQPPPSHNVSLVLMLSSPPYPF